MAVIVYVQRKAIFFVETSNEQGFFFFVTPSRSPRLDAYSMAFCVFVSSLLADAVSL